MYFISNLLEYDDNNTQNIKKSAILYKNIKIIYNIIYNIQRKYSAIFSQCLIFWDNDKRIFQGEHEVGNIYFKRILYRLW